MAFEDKTLNCRDCGNAFTWTAGEQEFYSQKGFQNEPSRCQDCRKKHKEDRNSQRVMTKIKCKKCGKDGEVPFQPRDPDDILCADCFGTERDSGGPKEDKSAQEPVEDKVAEEPVEEPAEEKITEEPAEKATPTDEE